MHFSERECEYEGCDKPCTCFHYCQEHHLKICLTIWRRENGEEEKKI